MGLHGTYYVLSFPAPVDVDCYNLAGFSRDPLMDPLEWTIEGRSGEISERWYQMTKKWDKVHVHRRSQ